AACPSSPAPLGPLPRATRGPTPAPLRATRGLPRRRSPPRRPRQLTACRCSWKSPFRFVFAAASAAVLAAAASGLRRAARRGLAVRARALGAMLDEEVRDD